MLLLIGNDAPLGPEWLDHPLEGDWADHRECHIGGDFLLIYRLDGNAIVFVRAGTHSELFEEGFRHAVTACRCAAPSVDSGPAGTGAGSYAMTGQRVLRSACAVAARKQRAHRQRRDLQSSV